MTCYEYLTFLNKTAHEALSNCNDICEQLNNITKAFKGSGLTWLEHCVRETTLNWYMKTTSNEKSVYEWVKSNEKNLFKDFSIVKRKNHPKHIPDFWVSNGIEYRPVECKLREFNKAALKQLLRYMNFYNCKSGYAIAKELTVKLPDNIIFIKYTGENNG